MPADTASSWVTDHNAALFTDLYELTMLRAYMQHGRTEAATFDLFVRALPPGRNYLIAAGLNDALHYLEHLRFSDDALAYIAALPGFDRAFADELARFRFTGDVCAVREGTPVFPGEPILHIVAPLPEAQLVETFLLNQIQLQTMLATKARRVVVAAQGRTVMDFGCRRAHGTDAGMKGARAFYLSGIGATSNVLAGQVYGIPVAGTMAHSFVQTFDTEARAFEAFAETFPDSVLLVDTYDTLAGIRTLIRLARQEGGRFRIRAIRLDSGDLAALARDARALLDGAGLPHIRIFASGGLEETEIRELLASGAPIDGFGVGTALSVSEDAPSLEIVYKLASYGGEGRMKLSPGKETLPGRKQVYRFFENGTAVRDVIATDDETLDGGVPLLEPVMRNGRRLPAGTLSLPDLRTHAQQAFDTLPEALRQNDPAPEPYPVLLSPRLEAERDRVRQVLRTRAGLPA